MAAARRRVPQEARSGKARMLEAVKGFLPVRVVVSTLAAVYEAVSRLLEGIEIETVTETIKKNSLSDAIEAVEPRTAEVKAPTEN